MLFITHLHPLGRAAMRARPISLVLPDEAVGIETVINDGVQPMLT